MGKAPQEASGGGGHSQGEGRAGRRMGRWKGKAVGAFKRNLPPWGMKISFVLKNKQANTCSAQLNTNSQSYYLLFLPRQHSGTSLRQKGFPVCRFEAIGSRRQPFRRGSDTTNKSNEHEGRVGGPRERYQKAACVLLPAMYTPRGFECPMLQQPLNFPVNPALSKNKVEINKNILINRAVPLPSLPSLPKRSLQARTVLSVRCTRTLKPQCCEIKSSHHLQFNAKV